jgi:hypothetical protein
MWKGRRYEDKPGRQDIFCCFRRETFLSVPELPPRFLCREIRVQDLPNSCHRKNFQT